MDAISVRWYILERVFLVSEVSEMPSDIVSIAVTTGLGISVVAGILSGLCYVLAHKVPRNSNRKAVRKWYCCVCNTNLRSINGILEGDKALVCEKCNRHVCKAQCSTFSPHLGWVCKTCHGPPESWFKAILSAIQLNPLEFSSGIMNPNAQHKPTDTSETKQTTEREQVRDFIERLVNVMLGENVDDANISKLYNDKSYDDIFSRYHHDLSNALTDLSSALNISITNLPVTGQSPCTAHAALKNLIERLLKESERLPKLKNIEKISEASTGETNRTYEDLLATAIINKVISSGQNNIPTSSAASVSSRISNSSRNRDEKEYFFGPETLDSKWRTTDLETSSVSSLEEWIHSDSSFGSKKYVDKFTLTIKQDIEEVSQSNSDEDDSEYFRAQSSLLSDDEPNWFLQKRQFQGTHSPVPVPMLVPNPTTDAKVLIGDKEVDETSDLSDIASDFEETDLVPSTHSLLIESKNIIGGKNPLKNEGSESETSADSGVKEVDGTDKSVYDVPTTFLGKADITVDDDNVEDASIQSVYSNTEQEAEYTERYASLPRTVLKTPTPPRRQPIHRSKSLEKRNSENTTDKQDEDSTDQEIEVFSGNYSRREKEKWKHAIQMENNPYSIENIEKRIRRSSSSVSSLFGPDYYAKQASLPAGTRLKSPEGTEVVWPAMLHDEETQEVTITFSDESYMNSNQEDDVFEISESKSSSRKPRISTLGYEVQDKVFGTPKTSHSDTSDTDLSIVNCYNVENSQIYKSKGTTLDINSNCPDELDKHHSITSEVEETSSTRERPRYIKLNSFKPHTITPTINLKELKRHKSETDLQSSFDAPPKVISRKKDNTLISKIYSNPHVRGFALSSRQQLPIESNITLVNLNRYNGKKTLYNSDEGISLGRLSTASSLDNLVDLDDKPTINYVPATTKKYRVKSVSSEDNLHSVDSFSHKPLNNHIYSSNEDLLSFKTSEHPAHKKDNTIISKIYQDQKVRNFALSARSYSSDHEFSTDTKTSEIKVVELNEPLSISIPSHETVVSAEKCQIERKALSPMSPDIEELAKKKIVHCILDQISKSQPNLGTTTNKSIQEEKDGDEEINISVKALRKKFEGNDAKNPVISSLTARSLSKQMINHLRN